MSSPYILPSVFARVPKTIRYIWQYSPNTCALLCAPAAHGSLDDCMKVVSTNIYRPGTWEFAASSVYWDAHYQAALFFLSYGVGAWINTPGAIQRPQAVPALRAVRMNCYLNRKIVLSQ